jgi:hypothetical protein
MKKIIFLFLIITLACINTSCYDRDILDSKEGVIMPTVSNLQFTTSGNQVTLSWTLPSNIPAAFMRPVSVNVQILRYRPGVLSATRLENRVLPDEALTLDYVLPSDPDNIGYEYHAIVKLVGTLNESVYGYSSQIYSLGQTVILK